MDRTFGREAQRGRCWRRCRGLPALLLALGVFLSLAARSGADDVGTAEATLQQSSATRAQAEQQLQAARGDVSALQAQLRTNTQQAAELQNQVAALQRQAAANDGALTAQANDLLAKLNSERATLRSEQQAAMAQEQATRDRLSDLHQQLQSLQAQIQSAAQEQQRLTRQSAELRQEVRADQAKIARDQQASDTALVQLYKLSHVSALQLLLSGQGLSDGLGQVMDLGLLGERDRALLAQTAHDRDVAKQQEADLQADLQALQQLGEALASDHQQVEVRTAQETALLQQLQQQQAAAEQAFQHEDAILNAALAATRQRLAQTEAAEASQAEQLNRQQGKVRSNQAAEQRQLGLAQQTAGLAQQRVLLATQAEDAARALVQRLTAPPTPTAAPAAEPGGGFSNPFPYGQCTWWALRHRPDLLGTVWGNAWQWVGEAAAHGRSEGSMPRVGAIVVFQPGVQGADWYGHVGYVTQVGSGGSFAISEMNFYGWAETDVRWVSTGWGVSFIY